MSEISVSTKKMYKKMLALSQVLSLIKISDMDFPSYYSDLSDVISSVRALRCLVEADTNHGVITTNTALSEAVNKCFACKSRVV